MVKGRCLYLRTKGMLFLVQVACLLLHFQLIQQNVQMFSFSPWKTLCLLKSAQPVQQSGVLGTAISCCFAQVHMPICFWEM